MGLSTTTRSHLSFGFGVILDLGPLFGFRFSLPSFRMTWSMELLMEVLTYLVQRINLIPFRELGKKMRRADELPILEKKKQYSAD